MYQYNFRVQSGAPNKAHTSMDGWSIRPVGPVCHGSSRVSCFFVGLNEFEILFNIAIAFLVAPSLQFGPRIQPSQSSVSAIFADLYEMLLDNNQQVVVAPLRREKRERELVRPRRGSPGTQRWVLTAMLRGTEK